MTEISIQNGKLQEHYLQRTLEEPLKILIFPREYTPHRTLLEKQITLKHPLQVLCRALDEKGFWFVHFGEPLMGLSIQQLSST